MKAKKSIPFDFSETEPESSAINPNVDEKEALPEVCEETPRDPETSLLTSDEEDS